MAERQFTAEDLLRDALVAGPTDPPTDSWDPIDLAALPDKPPTEPNLGDTHLIYPGKRHVFSGPPESAKTLAAYAILIRVAQTRQPAALIDFEMGAYDARQRLQELGATKQDLAWILYLEPNTPATPERINQLSDHKPELVVIDAAAGAYDLEGLDDNKRQDVGRFARLYITLFWQAGIATILIDHVVKQANQRGRFAIGSERKLGASDVSYGFDTITAISRGTSGRYKITTHKDRAGYMKRGHCADLHLDSDPDTHQISWRFTEPEETTGEGGYFRPTHLMEKASIDLETRPEPVSRNQVYEALGGTKDYVLKAINALVIEGFVTETDGPRRAKLLTSTRRYRADDTTCNPDNPATSSVVRELFGSSSENGSAVSGSLVRGVLTPEPDRPPSPHHSDQPEDSQWFDTNGNLQDTDLTYLESITPDDETEE